MQGRGRRLTRWSSAPYRPPPTAGNVDETPGSAPAGVSPPAYRYNKGQTKGKRT